MADSDQTLKILIEFGMDPTKAREAIREIDKIKIATADSAKDSKKFLEEDKKDTEKSTSAKHDLRAAFHSLGHVIPGIGGLARGMFSAMTFGILAAGVAIHALKQGFDKFQESLKSGLSFGGMMSDMDKLAKALIDGKISSEQFAESVNKIAKAQESLKTETEKATQAIKGQEAAELEGHNKRKALAYARIEEMEKLGRLTHAQAIVSKLSVDKFFENQEANTKAKAAAAAIAAHEIELARSKSDIAALGKLLPGAEKQEAGAKVGLDKSGDLIEKQKEAVKQVQAEIKRHEDEIRGTGLVSRAMGFSEFTVLAHEAEIASKKKLLAEAEANLEQLRAGLEGRTREFEQSKGDSQNLKKQITDLQTRITELERSIPEEVKKAGVEAAERAGTAAVTAKTRLATAAGEIGSGKEALPPGGKIPQLDPTALNQITRDIITGMEGTKNAYLDAFRDLNGDVQTLKRDVERELKTVHRKMNSAGNHD